MVRGVHEKGGCAVKRSKTVLVVVMLGLFLVGTLAMAGCSSSTPKPPTPPPPTPGNVTGESITATAGSTFKVSLAANPTTGYVWSITKAPDTKVVTQQGEPTYIWPVSSSATVGAGGTEVWTFKAVAAGSTNIVFTNTQVGNTTAPPAWTHNVSVKVIPPTPAPPKPLPIKTYTNPSTPISASPTQEFHINRSEQTGSTGFKWLLNSGYNHTVCVFEGVTFINSTSSAVGAASTEVWKFKALAKGTTYLTFNYVQPFDTTAKPAKTVTFTVNVK